MQLGIGINSKMKKLFFQKINIDVAKQPKEAMVVLSSQEKEVGMACFVFDSAKMTDNEWREMLAKHIDKSITGIVAEEALYQHVFQAVQSHFPQYLPLLKKYQGKLTLVEDNKLYLSSNTLRSDDALKQRMAEIAQTPFALLKEDSIAINAASLDKERQLRKKNRREGMLWGFIISLPIFLYVLISHNVL